MAPPHRPDDAAAERHEAAAAALLAIARLWRGAIDRRLAPRGLSSAAWRALWHLRAPGAAPVQAELAARMGIERPTLAGLLDRMERDGLVERLPDPDDRRANRVQATRAGRALMRPVDAAVAAVRARALGGLTQTEIDTLIALLERVRAPLEAPDDEARARNGDDPTRRRARPRRATTGARP